MKTFYRLIMSSLLLTFCASTSYGQVTADFDYFDEGSYCQGPHYMYFINLSQGDIISYFWDFGDGHSSTQMDPMHEFQQDGMYLVTLTVSDSFYVDTRSQMVEIWTEPDFMPPYALCQDLTMNLDELGNLSLSENAVDAGSWDECSGIMYDTDFTNFSCYDIGLNMVSLTVTDDFGNSSSCQSWVVIQDDTDPIANCQDLTVQLDETGTASISEYAVDNESWDFCGGVVHSTDITSFGEVDLGVNEVTLTVTDENGNSSTCSSTVTVEDYVPDNQAPVALCQDVFVLLSATGTATIEPSDIDNGSFDDGFIESMSLDMSVFSCENVGVNTVTFTVGDDWGATDQCIATVTVEDDTAPVMEVPADIVVSNDPGECHATVYWESWVSDNCGIEMLFSSHNPGDEFENGTTTVTTTATDNSGNSISATFMVTVIDDESPIIINCPGSIVSDTPMINLPEPVVANDNCGIESFVISHPWDEPFPIGTTEVEIVVSDYEGNVSTCITTVTVNNVIVEDNPNDFGPVTKPTRPWRPRPITDTKKLDGSPQIFGLFPNPAREIIKLTFPISDLERSIQIFDLTGRKVNETTSSLSLVSINVSEYESGMYFVKVKDANGDVQSRKFFVE